MYQAPQTLKFSRRIYRTKPWKIAMGIRLYSRVIYCFVSNSIFILHGISKVFIRLRIRYFSSSKSLIARKRPISEVTARRLWECTVRTDMETPRPTDIWLFCPGDLIYRMLKSPAEMTCFAGSAVGVNEVAELEKQLAGESPVLTTSLAYV